MMQKCSRLFLIKLNNLMKEIIFHPGSFLVTRLQQRYSKHRNTRCIDLRLHSVVRALTITSDSSCFTFTDRLVYFNVPRDTFDLYSLAKNPTSKDLY